MDRIPVEEHAAHVAGLLAPLRERGVEEVPLGDALGRVTATAVTSPIDLPPFRNSQMDGVAVRAADVASAGEGHPVTLPVVGESAARPGEPPVLPRGAAIRIMTGAPVPPGADAIVPVEDTSPDGAATDGDRVLVRRGRAVGEYVREPGSDLAAGAVLLGAGVRIGSRHIGALAAAGLTTVAVTTRIRVAVISTGSELASPGEPLGPGRIPDANGPALTAAVAAAGAEVVLTGRVHDDTVEFAALLDAAVAADAELVITSGGVSEGDHEVVRELLEPLGARVGTVAMQPGGPQATARYGGASPGGTSASGPPATPADAGVPVICFPGNPVSSQLSLEIFVAPLLREVAGIPALARGRRRLAHDIRSVPGRRQFLRGRMRSDGTVEQVAGAGSHLVAALAAADVLLVVPEDVVALAAGAEVETWEL